MFLTSKYTGCYILQAPVRVGLKSSRSEKWKKYICFHFYPRSKKWNVLAFTLFEKCKVKRFCFHSFSRSESEIKMTRDREVKFQKNSREFSRIETLAGHWISLDPQSSAEMISSRDVVSTSPGSRHSTEWVNFKSWVTEVGYLRTLNSSQVSRTESHTMCMDWVQRNLLLSLLFLWIQ